MDYFLKTIYKHRWDQKELMQTRKVWEVIVKHYFQSFINYDSRILDIGCGFCHFINIIRAKEKVGIDANPDAKRFADSDVKFLLVKDLSLKEFTKNYFDYIFISNFFEHLNNGTEVINLLKNVKDVLKPEGRILILQPNFRLCGAAYFDFIDHKTILTDKSLEEAFKIVGLSIKKRIIRFLPYTTKSNIPKWPFGVRLYLILHPLWYFMGKQSFYILTKETKI